MNISATHLVILPSYNSGARLRGVIEEVLAQWQPVLVVLDGCTDGSAATLADLARAHPSLTVLELPRNSGKGAAVLAGAAAALARGFTHALVMDADGQHPAASIAEFMAASQAQPDALVLGRPQFPSNIPAERLHGRKLSVGLVHFELFGAGIDDPLFGFRVYPLAPLMRELGARSGGRRYDFDTEAAVRLAWSGVRPVNLAAPVRYFSRAEGGVSHFHYVRDNATLVWMHTRLIIELLLLRWPQLLRHRRAWRSAAAAALLLTGVMLPLRAAEPTTPVPPPPASTDAIDPASPAWAELFGPISASQNTVAKFTERRHFPFRKEPVELTGVVRVSTERALSLDYQTPEARIVVLDDHGVLLRDARGERSPPADARGAAANAALVHVLRFDFHALEKDFAIRGRRTDAGWTIVLAPRSAATQRSIGQITVQGDGTAVHAIELRRSAKQFIEIRMSDAEARAEFTAEELKRFFR